MGYNMSTVLNVVVTKLLSIGVMQVGISEIERRNQGSGMLEAECHGSGLLVSFTGVISRCGQARRRYSARTKCIIMMLEISAYIEV